MIAAISKFLNIKKEYVYIGTGSSQFISAIVGLSIWKRVFISNIEFSLYNRVACANKKEIKYIEGITVNDFLENLRKYESDDNDVLCISSPRWFSGELFSKLRIQKILKFFNGTVLIDEAYIDYSCYENGMIDLALTNNRIIILRSFSKKFLASGYRVGYAITREQIDGLRNTIIPPHSVSSYSENFFINLLNDKKILNAFEETRKYIMKNRDLLYEKLNGSENFKIIKSEANFISLLFYDTNTMEIVYNSLKDLAGIQKFDYVLPFIKIWISNEKFSNVVSNRIKELVR